MTIAVTHSTPADASFSASGATAWNANHTLTGVGTMATQNANSVTITGGTLNGVAIGQSVAGDAIFDVLTANVTNLTNVTSSAGIAITGTFTGSSPSDGLVMDYSTGWGRFSAFGGDGFQWYNAGLATTKLMEISSTGALVTLGTVTANGVLLTGNLGTVTSVTGTAPVVSSGGTTPAISMAAATTSVNGYLTSTDWTTFNGKQAALVSGTNIKTVGSTSILGSGDIPVVTSIVAGTNITISPVGGTGAVTINATGGGSTSPAGSNTQVQFNNSGSFGASSALTWDGTTLKATNLEATNGVLADSSFSGTYVDGIVMDYTSGAGRISVGGADSLNFYNGGVAGSLLGSVNNAGDWSITRFLDIGNGTLIGGATNPILAAAGSANNYVQAYIHNDNAGISASADFVSYPDNGADAHGWVDMGVTSSTYADTTYTCTGPNESYLFGSAPSGSGTTGNLVYATDSTGTANAHQWYVGGFTQAKSAWNMQLTSTGLQLANALSIGNGGTGATTAGAALTNLGAQATLVSGTSIKTVNSTSLLGSGDVAVQPTLVSATNIKTINGASILGSGDLTVTGSFTGGTLTSNLTLATGTTSVIPLTLVSGTLNTTASAGAVEYLGNTPYFSIAASTRGVLRTEQWVVLTGTNTLTSQTGVQPIFDGGGGPTNGSVTLPVGTYQFECVYALTAMSATSGSFGFALGGAATFTYSYDATASKAGTAAATSQAGFKLFSSAAATALVTNSTGTVGSALIKGIIRVTVAGTIIPQVSLTVAAAAIVSANSYFKVSPLGNVSTVATVGNWA